MKCNIISLVAYALMLLGCSEYRPDARLQRLYATATEYPEEALSELDGIDRHSLGEADRHYYDFLKVKASDKAYVKHTSDSLILSVIDYYSSGKSESIYSEALYLGGRVYCELGDYPTALQYFHKALEETSENDADNDRKAMILSQTGRLLTSINLFDEAIPYIEESIRIGEEQKDTANAVYDIQLLGGTYLRAQDYPHAEECFRKALRLSRNLPESFGAKSRMYLAATKEKAGQKDSALNLIRHTVDLVNPVSRNNALAYAATIYLENDIPDSAYMYAYELLHSPKSINREIAYQVLLDPKLRRFEPMDTINRYISEYVDLLESYYDGNASTLAINQQSLYNYQTHERARIKAESSSARLRNILIGAILIILLMAVVILFYRNRNIKNLVELHMALDNVDKLEANINALKESHRTEVIADKDAEDTDDGIASSEGLDTEISEISDHEQAEACDMNILADSLDSLNEAQRLRERLREKLLSLYHDNPKPDINPKLMESAAFLKLQELIKTKSFLSFDSPLWDELEEAVVSVSPKFKTNLRLLIQKPLTPVEMHTALLVKCHVLPSQMICLLNISKGAVVSRRESLCVKIFGEKLGTKVIDGIIRVI